MAVKDEEEKSNHAVFGGCKPLINSLAVVFTPTCNPNRFERAHQNNKNIGMGVAHHSGGWAWWVWYVVAAPLHTSTMNQVGASAGNDVAAAHIHSDAHHAVRGHPTTGRGDHRGDMSSTRLRVKVGAPAALPVQLGLGVVGVGCPAGERSLQLAFSDVFQSWCYITSLESRWRAVTVFRFFKF